MKRGNGCPRFKGPRMTIQFEWDERKAQSNLAKHGVRFADATLAFFDPFKIVVYDERHSLQEARFFVLGEMLNSKLVAVAYADIEGIIRIISARKASAKERRHYHEEKRRFFG
jgi:uncharacterized DUF497 family protein